MLEPFVVLGAGMYAAAAVTIVWVAVIDVSTPEAPPDTWHTRHAAACAEVRRRRPDTPVPAWLAEELLLEAAWKGVARALTGLFAPPPPGAWLAHQLSQWQPHLTDRQGDVVELAPFFLPPPPAVFVPTLELEAVA